MGATVNGTGGCRSWVSRRRRRRVVVVLVGALLAAGPLTVTTAGAETDELTLCEGYAKCRTAGFTDAGYQANSARSFWSMYVGPNCTNYVAYRLMLNGLGNRRPPADPGRSNVSLNAFAWGDVYASRTSTEPAVGSVAWWKADANPSGLGHVAYVESVDNDGSVVISEDSWSGDPFAWRRLTPDQGWPDGFIHFRGAQAPAAQEPDVWAY